MRGEPEIVVAREVDHLLAVDDAPGGLLVGEHAHLAEGALRLEFGHIVVEELQGIHIYDLQVTPVDPGHL